MKNVLVGKMSGSLVSHRGLLRSLMPQRGHDSDHITDTSRSDTAAEPSMDGINDDNDTAGNEDEVLTHDTRDADDVAIRKIQRLAKLLSFAF